MTTKYTAGQRAAIAAAFRFARERIASGSHTYICHALLHYRAARNIIQHRTGPRYAGCSVNTWLVCEGHATWEEVENPATMRAYRLRWLDALIEEFGT